MSYIYLASVDEHAERPRVAFQAGARRWLISYFHASTKRTRFFEDVLPQFEGVKVLVDSGAFTFLNTIQGWNRAKIDKYLADYVDYLSRNKESIDAAVELDLCELLGYAKIKQWEEAHFKPLEYEGMPIIYVWHPNRQESGWEEMCRRHHYVGVTGVETATASAKLHTFLNVARRYCCKVHGFGFTKTSLWRQLPWYSSDSVAGDSSVLVKTPKGDVLSTSIAEFYSGAKGNVVLDSRGVSKILPEGYKTLTVDDDNQPVWGDLTAVIRHTVKRSLVRLKIEKGQELVCTPDHGIITMDSEGNLKEALPDEVEVGSYVLGPASIPAGEEDPRLDDDFLTFLGYWVGNGHIGERYVGISGVHHVDVLSLCERVASSFGGNVCVGQNGFDARIPCVKMASRMRDLGFFGHSHTKRVPSFVYSLSRRQVGLFLRGYFSADGSAHNGKIFASTVSEGLAVDLRNLLTIFGIVPHIRVDRNPKPSSFGGNRKPLWNLAITSASFREKFQEHIGFILPYKNKNLEQHSTVKRNGTCSEGVPCGLSRTGFFTYGRGKDGWKQRYASSGFKGRMARTDKENFSPKVLESGLFFFKVESVEAVNPTAEPVHVFDFSVKGREKFFANGILVHNSSTWTMGERFGITMSFNGRTIVYHKDKSVRMNMRPVCDKLGVPFMSFVGGDNDCVNTINAHAYVQYEELILRLHQTRGEHAGYRYRLPYPQRFMEMEEAEQVEAAKRLSRLMDVDPSTDSGKIIMMILCCIGNNDEQMLGECDPELVDDAMHMLKADDLKTAQDNLYEAIRPKAVLPAQRSPLMKWKPTKRVHPREHSLELGLEFGSDL